MLVWGSSAPFRTDKLWKASVDPKCRYFACLVLHGKVLTADNLAIRGWPYDPTCKLCRINPETVQHLLLDCNFITALREATFAQKGTIWIATPTAGRSINSWWDDTIAALPKERRREANAAFIYAMWGA